MRLNKYLGESGQWSRREADTLIEEGRVTINGAPASLGAQVAEGDEVKVDGDIVGRARKLDRPVYIALNKPIGITCTTERHVEGNIIDFVDHPERIFPIGRLDKESEGLILLTNDGDIVNEVLRSEHNHEKEYVVAVDRALAPDFVERMSSGIRLAPEGMTKRCKVRVLGPKLFAIILTQGLNRQIRRMCEALAYTVVALQRVRFMNVMLGPLAIGRWRNLTPQELEGLRPPRTDERDRPNGGRPSLGGRSDQRSNGGGHPGGGRPNPGAPSDQRSSGGRPDGGGPGRGRSVGGGPGRGRPDGGRPGGGRPDGGRPNGGRPSGGRPGGGRPGGGRRGGR
jgi:23S rRNA pseudouridine2604 synthase